MRLQKGWRARVADVLETVCAEAAVLLLVFPLLDEFVQRGREGISWRLAAISVGLCLFFLTLALLIAVLAKREDP